MIMEELIQKYLSNELNEEEWTQLKSWLDSDEINQKSLNKLHSFMMSSSGDATHFKESLWEELQTKMNQDKTVPVKTSKRSNLNYFVRIAAALLIALTLSMIVHQSLKSPETVHLAEITIEKVAPKGGKLTTRLPDGTIVTLNSGSKITFPKYFNGNKRSVHLIGEAFFDVKRDESRPFDVSFNNDEVRVLGTSFNINAYDKKGNASVAVASGRVAFAVSSIDSEMILTKGDMAVFNSELKQLSKRFFDEKEIFGWKDKLLFFQNKSLEEMIPTIERWYGVQIVKNGTFSNQETFTGEFEDKPLKEVLTGLSYLYDFKYEIKNDKVEIHH